MAFDTSLCARCLYGVVYRRRDHADLTAYCKTVARDVASDIAACSHFKQRNTLDLDAMVELAVPIDVRDGINGKAYL